MTVPPPQTFSHSDPANAPTRTSPLRRVGRKAGLLLSVFYTNMLQYRAELLLWALAGSMPFIMMGVWMEAARSGHFGKTPEDMARYFISVFVMRQLTAVWVIYNFEEDMVSGKLSPQLLMPMDPGWRYLSSHLAERGARLPFVLVMLVIFFLVYPQALWTPSPWAVLLALVLSQVGFLLRYITQYCVAMLTFWTERAMAIEHFYFLIFTFLSGVIAPLETFPAPLREAVMWTPFPYIVYVPAAILTGAEIPLLKTFVVTGTWLVLLTILNRWLWRMGLKRYSGMGA